MAKSDSTMRFKTELVKISPVKINPVKIKSAEIAFEEYK